MQERSLAKSVNKNSDRHDESKAVYNPKADPYLVGYTRSISRPMAELMQDYLDEKPNAEILLMNRVSELLERDQRIMMAQINRLNKELEQSQDKFGLKIALLSQCYMAGYDLSCAIECLRLATQLDPLTNRYRKDQAPALLMLGILMEMMRPKEYLTYTKNKKDAAKLGSIFATLDIHMTGCSIHLNEAEDSQSKSITLKDREHISWIKKSFELGNEYQSIKVLKFLQTGNPRFERLKIKNTIHDYPDIETCYKATMKLGCTASLIYLANHDSDNERSVWYYKQALAFGRINEVRKAWNKQKSKYDPALVEKIFNDRQLSSDPSITLSLDDKSISQLSLPENQYVSLSKLDSDINLNIKVSYSADCLSHIIKFGKYKNISYFHFILLQANGPQFLKKNGWDIPPAGAGESIVQLEEETSAIFYVPVNLPKESLAYLQQEKMRQFMLTEKNAYQQKHEKTQNLLPEIVESLKKMPTQSADDVKKEMATIIAQIEFKREEPPAPKINKKCDLLLKFKPITLYDRSYLLQNQADFGMLHVLETELFCLDDYLSHRAQCSDVQCAQCTTSKELIAKAQCSEKQYHIEEMLTETLKILSANLNEPMIIPDVIRRTHKLGQKVIFINRHLLDGFKEDLAKLNTEEIKAFSPAELQQKLWEYIQKTNQKNIVEETKHPQDSELVVTMIPYAELEKIINKEMASYQAIQKDLLAALAEIHDEHAEFCKKLPLEKRQKIKEIAENEPYVQAWTLLKEHFANGELSENEVRRQIVLLRSNINSQKAEWDGYINKLQAAILNKKKSDESSAQVIDAVTPPTVLAVAEPTSIPQRRPRPAAKSNAVSTVPGKSKYRSVSQMFKLEKPLPKTVVKKSNNNHYLNAAAHHLMQIANSVHDANYALGNETNTMAKVRHYSLLHHIYYCFFALELFVKSGDVGIRTFPEASEVADMLYYRGANLATPENVLAMAHELSQKMPKQLLNIKKPYLNESALSQANIQAILVAQALCQSDDPFPADIENTALYKQLAYFHKTGKTFFQEQEDKSGDMGENQIWGRVLENIIPDIYQIMQAIQAKDQYHHCPTPLTPEGEVEYKNLQQLFGPNLYALRMLFSILGDACPPETWMLI